MSKTFKFLFKVFVLASIYYITSTAKTAAVAKLADALDSGSSARLGCAGSSPVRGKFIFSTYSKEKVFYNFLYKHAKRNSILIFLALFIGFTLVMQFLSFGVRPIKALTGQNTLDSTISFSVDKCFEILTALGKTGREMSLKLYILDFFYPVIIFLLFACIHIYNFDKRLSQKKTARYLFILAAFAFAADYLENIASIILLIQFPDRLPIITFLKLIFTFLKFAGVITGVLFIIYGFLKVFIKKNKSAL